MSADPDIAAMSLQLARDPASLVFLPLAEALRRAGDLGAALPLAENGIAWYPEMSGAWDLLARIRSDRGEGDLAFDAWTTALRLDPDHAGAHKGLAFLAFRAGELERSVRHLRKALELAPDDPGVRRVLDRVEGELAGRTPVPAPASPLASRLSGAALLLDLRGRPLEGRLDGADGGPASEAAGAAAAALSRDAERTARLLELGPWRRVSLSGGQVNLEVRSPTIDSLLIVQGPVEAPAGALAAEADRLRLALGHWLEAMR